MSPEFLISDDLKSINSTKILEDFILNNNYPQKRPSLTNECDWPSVKRWLIKEYEKDLTDPIKSIKKFGNFPEFTGGKISPNKSTEQNFSKEKIRAFSWNYFYGNLQNL